jgi:hypothetical protein
VKGCNGRRTGAHATWPRSQALHLDPRVLCPECDKATRAELPADVQGHFGPLTALIGCLSVVCRMPRRVTQELREQVLGGPLSLVSIQIGWEEVRTPC